MSSVIFILGGARSGKTGYAQTLAEDIAAEKRANLYYVATGQAWDEEMKERISRHQQERNEAWKTIEAPLDLVSVLEDEAKPGQVLLIDCLTLWLTNILLADQDVEKAREDLVVALKAAEGPVIVVSNEVGLGIVPENALARQFRDEAGWLNQAVAKYSDRVVLVSAGLPLTLKDNSNI